MHQGACGRCSIVLMNYPGAARPRSLQVMVMTPGHHQGPNACSTPPPGPRSRMTEGATCTPGTQAGMPVFDKGSQWHGLPGHCCGGRRAASDRGQPVRRRVRATGMIGTVGLRVPSDPGAPSEDAAEGRLLFNIDKLFAKGLPMGTGEAVDTSAGPGDSYLVGRPAERRYTGGTTASRVGTPDTRLSADDPRHPARGHIQDRGMSPRAEGPQSAQTRTDCRRQAPDSCNQPRTLSATAPPGP